MQELCVYQEMRKLAGKKEKKERPGLWSWISVATS